MVYNIKSIPKEDCIITPNELLLDLKRISSIGDVRILILYLDLYIEYFVNAIYRIKVKDEIRKCNTCGKYIETKFKDKINKLSDIGFIKKEHKHDEIIKIIYDLRCRLIHNLRPDINLLEREIQKHKPDIQETMPLMSKYWEKVDPWIKIQLMAFPPITALYQEYEKVCERHPEYTIRFLINPEATMVQMDLIKI